MPSAVKTILQNNTVRWHWPVTIGLPPQSKLKPATLTRFHWAKELSRPTPINFRGQPLHYNIVLCNNPAEAAALTKITLPGNIAIRADVLLIKCEPSVFQPGNPSPGMELTARILANGFGASGVIFFHTSLPDERWFEMLMIELSHDLPITTAFKNIKPAIFRAFVSPELDHHTRLSTLISHISDGLIKGFYTLSKPVQYLRTNDQFFHISNAQQLGRMMKDDLPKMDYSGESKTGTTMLGVTPGVKATRPLPVIPLQKNTVVITERRFPLKGDNMLDMFRKTMKITGADKDILINKPSKAGKPSTGGGTINLPGNKKFTFTSADTDTGGRGFAPVSKQRAKPPGDKKSAKPPVKTGGIESLPSTKRKPAGAIVKKSSVKKNGGGHKKETDAPVSETTQTVPRFLQSQFTRKGDEKPVTTFLLPKTVYTLNVFIGEKDEDYQSTDIPVDTGIIFKNIKVKKAVIDLHVHCNTLKKPLIGKITIPREGNSSIAAFAINTGQKEKILEAAVYAYYKGNLLQKQSLRFDIRNASDKAVLKKPEKRNEVVLDSDISGQGNKTPAKASISEPPKTGKSELPAGHTNNKPLGFKYNTAFEALAKKIRDFIEKSVIDREQSKQPLTHESNVTLLRKLATQGSLLFRNHIKDEVKGLIQIVSVREEYTPLEFVYSKPAPLPEAGLCKNAIDYLKKGKCGNCKPPGADAHSHICPFGFWGISNVIERHKYSIKRDNPDNSDYILESAASSGRKVKTVLNRTQFAESERMGNGNAGLIKEVDTAITNNSHSAFKVNDWNSWKASVVKNDPDCYFLIVHMEEDERVGTDALEIGKEDLLPITLIEADLIRKEGNPTKMPLVVLIGCETSDLDSYSFGAPDLLIQTGSAIVLSNFTRIRGRQAGRIVIRLVELLKQYAQEPVEFGVVIRKLKQELLAEGNMVSLTLLAHGDADWKISTKA